MRKILSFLALLVVGFALPQWAHAWDMDSGTDPYKVEITYTKGITGGPTKMKYDGTNTSYKWSTEFTTGTNDYINFKLTLHWKNDRGETGSTQYGVNQGVGKVGNVAEADFSSTTNSYYHSGLSKNTTYRLMIKGNGKDKFKFWVEEIDKKLYLYQTGSNPTLITPISYSVNNKVHTYKVRLTGGTAFVLGTENNFTTWNNGLNGNRYSPDGGSDVSILDSGFKIKKHDNGAWMVPSTGTYTITVNMNDETISAVKEPDYTGAWNYSSNTCPVKVGLKFRGAESATQMTFDSTNKYWSYEFTAGVTFREFTVESYYENDKFVEYSAQAGANASEEWVYVSGNPQQTNKYFYLNKLIVGKTYRIELCNDGNATDAFKYRYVDLNPAPTKLYLYTVEGDDVTQIKEASRGDNDTFKFEPVDLGENVRVIVSQNPNASHLTGALINSSCFAPTAGTTIPVTNVAISNSTAGYFLSQEADTYTFTIDWLNKKATVTGTPSVDAPAHLYIYSSNPSWATRVASATPTKSGLFKFPTLKMTEGYHFVITTQDFGATANGYDALKGSNLYTPQTGDTDVQSGVETDVQQLSSGSWKTVKTGKYDITVDWGSKKFKAIIEEEAPAGVHLPLTIADFKDNKKHYFLVGERMGEWHLQPEWELEVNGNTAVLKDRYIYDGWFAIGVVDNFTDYANHKYKLYAYRGGKYDIKSDCLGCPQVAYSKDYTPAKNEHNNSPGQYFYSSFNGNYYEGRGQYVKEIKLTLNSSGAPTAINLTPGTFDESTKHRVFTLVGSDIYNQYYCNTSSVTHTPTWNENPGNAARQINGWQEGWIQFDPATNKPYVDARGEYLYLTSFTPDYMKANPVRFNMNLSDGKEFPYSSNAVQFLHWSQLPNLDKDPYRDYYEAFKGDRNMTPGTRKTGTNYDFKVQVSFEKSPATNEKDWECYVIPDMWMAGQVKFWTGWGGNQDYTQGGSNGLAVFHGPNGGPAVDVNSSQPVKGYDLNVGGNNVMFYHNAKNVNNSNYIVSSDGKPVYFNRVILWFNNTDGVAKSYIQFIQESIGPAIPAYATVNEATGKKNFITYDWYINKAAETNPADADLQVMSYEISRFRVNDQAQSFLGYPEAQKVDISDKNLQVKDLYEGHGHEFTKHLDTGAVPGQGFAPGIYQYNIYVTYSNGARKLAWSNRVTIYDDQMVTPDAVPMQLVYLRDAYTDAYGGSHESGQKLLNTTKRYLTYRPNDNANFYLLDIIEDEIQVSTDEDLNGKKKIWTPKDPVMIDAAKARDFLENHPWSYWWTSDYYVRCLDADEYNLTIQRNMDAGLITNSGIPTPILRLYDEVTVEGIADPVSRLVGIPQKYVFTDETGHIKNYYASIVKRGGNLSDAVFKTRLRLLFKNDKGEDDEQITHAYAPIDPVMPRPFDPKYRYIYKRPKDDMYKPGTVTYKPGTEVYRPGTEQYDDNGNVIGGEVIGGEVISGEKYQWGKVTVPIKNWKHETTSDALLAGDMKEVYVKFDEKFDPRNLTLQVEFFRPNVNEEIYKFYDIHYDINFTNEDRATNGKFVDLDVVLHDVDTDSPNFPNRYRMEFGGVHPRNDVWPVVTFNKTVYEPNSEVDSYNQPLKSSTGNYGKMITVNAVHTIDVNTSSEGLNNVHLGHIERVGENGEKTYDWMYKGHEDFKDEDEQLTPSDSEDLTEEQSVTPIYYLIELMNESQDYAYYNYLVPHDPNHVAERDVNGKPIVTVDKETGLLLNDTDPLIATYIAKGFKSNENPKIVTTAIYLFERPVMSQYPGSTTNFNRLEIVSYDYKDVNPENQNKIRKSEDPKNPRNLPTMGELSVKGYGELPDVDTTPTDNTDDILDMDAYNESGYKSYVAVKGATYTTTLSEDNVTGVEDVLAGYDDGEVVYYNMQGVRVAEPTAAGVYLKVQGRKVTKVVID